jgi:hypothetical protein
MPSEQDDRRIRAQYQRTSRIERVSRMKRVAGCEPGIGHQADCLTRHRSVSRHEIEFHTVYGIPQTMEATAHSTYDRGCGVTVCCRWVRIPGVTQPCQNGPVRKLIDHQAADDAGILAKGLLDAASPSLHSLVGMGADSPTVCEKEVRIEIATAHKSRVARSRPGQSPRPN